MVKKDLLDMTKEQERAELHRAIWQIANDLRGSVDGWDFKTYVLGMLFYRFISENLTNYINTDERRSGKKDFDYALLSDKEAEFGRVDTVKEKGFYILPSELFVNVCKNARNDTNLNESLSSVFNKIENSAKGSSSEYDLKGLFADLDVNSNKLGNTVEQRNQKLTKIVEAIGNLRLGNYSDNTIDAFGDAYEFLMTMYASNAGKSGGEFYTPQEVSELLAEITTVGKTEVNKVYDPACGSGSLLLKFAKVLGKENVRQGFFGQEINITTYNLCRINMFLHDINYNNFNIALGDTLTDPKHWDEEPFDAIVSNPPYSIRWEGDGNPLLINDPRYSPAGVLAPKGKADLAFTMHMLSWLSTSGTAAIVEFPGVLSRGGTEQKIRKYLVENNYVDTVIQLPSDLFFGTTITTCIIVLKKSKKDNKTLFINASEEFVRGGNKNKLTEKNINKILEAFIKRVDIDHFSKLIDNKLIAENSYNIAVSSYVDANNNQEEVDIFELNDKITQIVAKQNELRIAINQAVKDYESYSSELLNNDNKVRWATLGEVVNIVRGASPRPIQSFLTNDTNGVSWIKIGDVDPGAKYVTKTGQKITKEGAEKSRFLKKGSFILSNSMSFGRPYILAIDGCIHDGWIAMSGFENYFIPDFLYHLLKSTIVQRYWQQKASSGTVQNLNSDIVRSTKVPIPPIEKQKIISDLLDKFDSFVNDISAGLPAEISARQLQYDYYRNKLLTFT
jgi:type I restriction enzyme M protein